MADGSPMANQSNISKITPLEGAIGGIAVFNDAIRDGLKGSVFTSDSKGYISGAGSTSFPAVLFGMKGGSGTGASWSVKNSMVVNYMSAHDNNTLWDKLALSNADNTVEERLAMNRLGATILMVSKGTVFFQAGEEMLRTKPKGDGAFDENSYKSSDAVNNINWSVLKEGTNEYNMSEFYKGLIDMRKAYSIFRDSSTAVSGNTISTNGRAIVTLDDHKGGKVMIIINPTAEEMSYTLSTSYNLLCDGSTVGAQNLGTAEGKITIPAYTAIILANDNILNG